MKLEAPKISRPLTLILAFSIGFLGFSYHDGIYAADNTTPAPEISAAAAAEARLKEDITYLSSDELQGRAAETPGLKMGAEFIAKRWETLGLKTDLFDGKPFQEFALEGTPSVKDPLKNSLVITKPNGETVSLKLGEQFQPQSIGSNGEFNATLVFAGYGITAEEDNLNMLAK